MGIGGTQKNQPGVSLPLTCGIIALHYFIMSFSESSAPPLKVLTLGMGALGSIYSFILSRSTTPPCHVTCVARSNYATLSDPSVGMTIQSDKFGRHEKWVPHRVFEDGNADHHAQSQAEEYDFILCCQKVVDEGVPTSQVLKPWLKRGGSKKLPTIVMIQNGIGIEVDPYRELVQAEPPYARGISTGVAWIGANLKEKGTLVTHGSMDRIELGHYYPTAEKPVQVNDDDKDAPHRHQELFQRAYTSGGGGLDIKADIQPTRWAKLLWNAAWASICSLSRQSLSTMLDPAVLPYIVGPVRRTMLEVIDVARATGIGEDRLPIEAVDKAFHITYASRPFVDGKVRENEPVISTLSDGFKPSLLLDLEAGRPMELKAIIGNCVELARVHGVETPRLGECMTRRGKQAGRIAHIILLSSDMVLGSLRASQVQALKAQGTLSEHEADAKSHGNRLPAGVPVGLPW